MNLRFFAIIGLLAAFGASIAAPAMAGFHERMQPMLLAWPGPVLSPDAEIGLQTALACETAIADNSAILARTLREIAIRAALEDTARLRFEHG